MTFGLRETSKVLYPRLHLIGERAGGRENVLVFFFNKKNLGHCNVCICFSAQRSFTHCVRCSDCKENLSRVLKWIVFTLIFFGCGCLGGERNIIPALCQFKLTCLN